MKKTILAVVLAAGIFLGFVVNSSAYYDAHDYYYNMSDGEIMWRWFASWF